jgi:DNA-binding NtrC family response regulator
MNITDVLVVDDDFAVCRIVQRMLSNEQCKVQTSLSVVDAVVALEEKSFHAYVVNYKLPDGSGLDVAERIRSKWGAVPIILMWGYNPRAIALRAERLGVFDFLQKPFSREMLCAAVKKAIGSQEASKLLLIDPPAAPTASGGRSWTRFWQRPAKRPA